VIIPNERLKMVSEQRITFVNAFAVADDVLRQAVQSISELIQVPGLVNLDFADVTSVMKDAGYAHMGVGRASGKDKAINAANMAISSPLLETSIKGAKGVIINITAALDIGLDEVEQASEMIRAAAHEDANIIWGAGFDETMNDEMSVTVIATGFENAPESAMPTSTATTVPGFTSAKQPAAASAAPAAAPAAAEEQPAQAAQPAAEGIDDEEFRRIIDIFNKGH
jgi:cell division protein FtsZ